jgi:HD superfamily phosphohydrolase
MASDMFDSITGKDDARKILENDLSVDLAQLGTYRKIVRYAALLHDIGHAPFSHSGEELMPKLPNDSAKRYKHEDYSIAIIKQEFCGLIEDPSISVDDVTALLGDETVRLSNRAKAVLLWKQLISGQLDADRADYLLRDSRHLGVSYGLYDRDRLVSTMTLAKREETQAIDIAIQEKGWHLAESLIIARYQMFSQVYFHKVRRIYDHHISCAAKSILDGLGFGGIYPEPSNINEYIKLDDWRINAELKNGLGGKHGDTIMKRKHYKCVEKIENPTPEDMKTIKTLNAKYIEREIDCYLDDGASTYWYKLNEDILVEENGEGKPLSNKSEIVSALKRPTIIVRLYAEKMLKEDGSS